MHSPRKAQHYSQGLMHTGKKSLVLHIQIEHFNLEAYAVHLMLPQNNHLMAVRIHLVLKFKYSLYTLLTLDFILQ